MKQVNLYNLVMQAILEISRLLTCAIPFTPYPEFTKPWKKATQELEQLLQGQPSSLKITSNFTRLPQE